MALGAPASAGALVLLAEGEMQIRETIAETLTRTGYKVIPTARAGDAVASLEGQRLAPVTTDLRVPKGGMSYSQAARSPARFNQQATRIDTPRPRFVGARSLLRQS